MFLVSFVCFTQAKHASGGWSFGIDGETGKIVDMNTFGIWDPIVVKIQSIKTAVESASMLLRIDEIVAGMTKKGKGNAGPAQPSMEAMGDPDNDVSVHSHSHSCLC